MNEQTTRVAGALLAALLAALAIGLAVGPLSTLAPSLIAIAEVLRWSIPPAGLLILAALLGALWSSRLEEPIWQFPVFVLYSMTVANSLWVAATHFEPAAWFLAIQAALISFGAFGAAALLLAVPASIAWIMIGRVVLLTRDGRTVA